MSRSSKPTAPWTIYRFNFTMMMSLMHRITGVGITLVVWAGVLMWSEIFPPQVIAILMPWKNIFVWFVVWAMCYHTLNGIRHLIWDKGQLMEPKTLVFSGLSVWGCSLLLAWVLMRYGTSL